MKKPKVFVVVGATCSGKTAYAVKLAKKVGGEVISADSRQVYRGLDLGSGRVTKKEMAGVPHHLLDVASPKRVFTVSNFRSLTEKKMREIVARGKTAIIAGGTGFYIQAVVDGLVLPAVAPDKELRATLAKLPTEQLFARLKKLDYKRAKTIDAKNPARLIRAIEIATQLGQVPKLKKSKSSPYDFELIGLKIDQDKLNAKIKTRLAERLKKGMIAEVKNLHAAGLSWQRLEALGLEYRYVARYLQDKITKSEMIAQLEQAIIQYSKRQLTWFKRDRRIKWVEIEG